MEKSLYDQKPFSNIPLFRYLGPEYFTELKNRESRGHGNMAVSKSNAMGPFQIKEVALQELKNRYKELGHINKDALFDPGTSLKLASLYLDHIGDGMKSVLGKDKNPDPGLILAGYRLGPSYVTKILKTLPEDQRTWMGFRRHLSESGDMDDSQKTSVLKYLDTILMSAADPQSRDNKAYNTELKRAQSHPFFFYQTGNRVPDLGGGRSEHADGPDNSEDKNNLGDLLGRFKSLTGGIGSVMGTAGIANGDPTMGVVGSALSGFATAGLPGAVVQGGMGLISAYQNKANEELAMLESEEALRRSKSVGMDKGFDGYNQTLYQQGGPIKRRLHVIGNSNAKIYDDKKLMDLYHNVMPDDPQFKDIDNTLDVLWNQEPNSILPRVYTTAIRKNSFRLRNLIRESVLPPNYYDNIELLGDKKDALTADKYAEIYGEPKSTFETEYNRLSPELKKHYRDISYTAIDKQPQELEKILSGLSKDDQVMIMDHVGGKMLGIPMKQLSEIFKTHYPKDNKNPCLWGACDGATILPEFSNDSGINAIGTYLDQWKGGDPKKDNLINILFPDKTNRRLYKSDGSTEKLQLGSALRKAFSNRFLKSIILDEGEHLPINPSKYSFSEDIWPKKLNETVQLLDWQKNPNYNSSLIYGKGSIELAPYSLPYMHSPYVKEKFLSDAMVSPSKNRKGGIIEGVNQTGYTPGTDSFENDVNVIPSNIITMKDTPFDVLGIPNKGRAKLMKAGLRKIVFPGADYVTEIPIKQSGGRLRNPYIKEVTVTAEAPQWLKDKREYEKNHPKKDYINQYLTPFAKSLGNTETNYPKRLDEEYEQKGLDYVSEQLVKNKPQDKLSRAEWLNQMSDKEEEIIKRNPKYQSSLWADTKRGLTSLVEQNSLQTFQNILNSSDYTNREKQEMLKDYADHPVMSKLSDVAKILNPLTVPSKMVQSAYKDNYSFTDALKGKKNSAGIVEDIVTDPLNLVGVGLFGKLSKADKVIDATKAGSKVLNKTDDVVKPIISSVDDVGKQASKQWQLEELPGLHLKSTMEGQSISKIIEPKTGLVNVEQALGIIAKESGGADKVALIRQGLGENIPKKMDYNEFRKTVQDQLIPLEKQFSTHASDYGINRLGYNTPKMGGFNNRYVIKEAEAPLENQTLILGNKGKFGRGSSAHGNPDETLGHIHFLRDAETPDVLTVTQIQSDAFQGTHRIMPKDSKNLTALEKQQKSLARMEELQERNKSILHKMKTEGLDEAGLPVQDYQIKQFEDIVKAQEQSNLFKKADIENFTQKQLLDKNHQERYLQELVDYAGKRGDVNKVRVPTSETAAKVQGYVKQELKLDDVSDHDIILYNELRRKKDTAKLYLELNKSKNNLSQKEIDNLLLDINNPELKRIESAKKYSPEHQTILKKYSEQPKTIKKLFGEEPKIVTDKKGNTWYEFDIPNKFKEGKGEIKAFQVIPPAIGSALYLQSQNKNKSEQLKAGLRKIVFPGADYVTEIPIKQSGGRLRHPYIKEGFQAHTADGHYIEPNNFRIRPSTLELDNITKIPGRFSTPDTYPNDINYNRHTNMSDEQHKYLQDAYAKLKGMYVETARTPAFDPNEQFILDQDNARQLDYTLLKNRFGIKQTGGNISAINLNTDLGPIPNFRRRITTSNPLPVASQYAQDGSVYPPNAKVKVNHNNQIKEYDINSSEYRDLYNSGKLMSYDKTTDTYSATPLKEVTVTADAPQWLKYKRKYEETNPKSNYINSFLTPFAKSLGNTETNYPKRLDDEYEQKSLDYVSEQLIKNKPQGKLSRAEWLNQMSDKEEELIKRNPKYQSSLWADTKRGLTSLVEQNPLQTFQNILNSSDYTNREKKEMLKDYAYHPVMSKLGDITKILNPLTVPSKMTQSTYKNDYSFSDALKGKKNNAGIVEDIVTDPLNLVGAGLLGKISKTDKVIDATKVGSKVLNKTDDVLSKIGTPLNRPIDIHDIRKKYHNDLILQLDEMKLLQKEGKGNRANYRNVVGNDIVGKLHTKDIPIKDVNYDKKSIEEILFGKDYSTEKVANKGKTNNLENVDFNISNKPFFEENKLNIKSYKDEIENLIQDFKTDISVFERTETSMKADKWLNDWFNHPETKKAFINYGGTEKEWGDILNSLENPIRSSEKWGKGQPGGAYMDVFKQASIPIDAKVDVGVHEGIHKTGLLTKKSNPILNNLWNDFIDAVRETPTESYPEIFRLRYNLGLKPGQKIDMNTLEEGLKTIEDGYSISYKIKNKHKLLEIINKAPALIPFLGMYLQSQEQNKSEQ